MSIWAARKKAEFFSLTPEEKSIIEEKPESSPDPYTLKITLAIRSGFPAVIRPASKKIGPDTPDPSPSIENKPDVFPNPFHSPVTNYSDPSNLFAMPDLSTEVDHKPHNVFIQPFHSPAVANDLITTARALVYPRGKGIYATDETPDAISAVLHAAAGGIGKPKLGVEEGEVERRKQWREAAYKAIPAGE
ncbi:hypothetical protein H0H93_005877 [Arthromyces matolae]|nr:hypothetical protein H0H93_005877 [Arthromyces matolae]